MFGQFRALKGSKLYDFIKRDIEQKYHIKINLLDVEIGVDGDYDSVKKICLESCDGNPKN